MKLNEAIAARRRIGPLHAVDGAGDPVLGEDFSGLDEMLIMVAGGAWSVPTGTMVEIGDGYYYYQAALGDTSTRPWVAIRIAGVCQEFVMRENVTTTTDGAITFNEPTAALRRVGPLHVVDGAGDPILTTVGIVFEISINGSAWAAGAGTLTLADDGYVYYEPTVAEISSPGWIAMRLTGTCQEFVYREDINAGDGGFDPLFAPQLEVLTTFSLNFGTARLQPWQANVYDFPDGAAMVILVHYTERNEMYVARDAEGVWHWPFDIEPTNQVTIGLDLDADLSDDDATIQLLPRGGWPPNPIEIQVAAALEAVTI